MKKFLSAMFMCLLVASCWCLAAGTVFGQNELPQTNTRDDETNLDTQLYLIVGTNQEVADSKLPPVLDSVIKQLHAALPFKNYRLAATLVNRVKNEGRLNLRWLGGPFATAASSAVTPSFSEFKVRQVRLVKNSEGQPIIQMMNFAFGARIPVQTAAMAANGPAFPVINYENMGLDTDISMREGEPVVVGTV